jgi:hypothetical protein
MRHRASKGNQSVRDFPLNQGFQTKVKQLCFLPFSGIITRLRQEFVVDINRRSHAYNDAQEVCMCQADLSIN